MPKIAPRPEIASHPIYRAGMAAQHLAYQLMREVPADKKHDASRLHVACVHATTHATYALDPFFTRRAESAQAVLEAAADAKARLAVLAHLASDENATAELERHLDAMAAGARELLAATEAPAA